MHLKRLLFKKEEHSEVRRSTEIENTRVEVSFLTEGLEDKI